MGAGGVTRQTGRNNTVMPYNVGFLNKAEDTQNYNVAVYDELQKVSSASTHMFQAIDDIHAEIDQRIAALNAMDLKYDELDNRITTEIETAIAEIQTEMGNLDTSDIWDRSVNPPVKLDSTMAGIKVEISGNSTDIQQVTGIVNQQGQEIGVIQDSIKNKTGDMAQYMNLTEYEATWGVDSTVNGQYAGVKLTNDGTDSKFQVTANKFIVGDGTAGNTPFTFTNGRATMEFADITNVNITTAQIANAEINGANIKDATITSAKITSLNASVITVGRLQGSNWYADIGGSFVFGVVGAAQLVINNQNIAFYDPTGVLRIRIGTW